METIEQTTSNHVVRDNNTSDDAGNANQSADTQQPVRHPLPVVLISLKKEPKLLETLMREKHDKMSEDSQKVYTFAVSQFINPLTIDILTRSPILTHHIPGAENGEISCPTYCLPVSDTFSTYNKDAKFEAAGYVHINDILIIKELLCYKLAQKFPGEKMTVYMGTKSRSGIYNILSDSNYVFLEIKVAYTKYEYTKAWVLKNSQYIQKKEAL